MALRFFSALTLVAIIPLLGLSSCEKKSSAPVPDLQESVTSQEIWERITVLDPYKKYKPWPGRSGFQNGKAPHGAYYKLFTNPAISSALPLESPSLPAQSVIVKESYNSSKELTAIYVMAKIPDYNPESGDWFWATYKPDGKVNDAGKIKMCIDCHTTRKANDYVMFSLLTE